MSANNSSAAVAKWTISPIEVEWNRDDVLGRGAFGTVFKGKCRGVDVAVKRLQRQIRPQNLRELIAEVDTMSSILHPNVLLFMGVCVELGDLMIVTELMPNGTLEEVIKARKSHSTTKVMQLAKDAALGVNWLHGSNIIHSDIKPSNFLLDAHFRVKVSDFGLSFRMEPGKMMSATPRGSPIYMSPECLSGQPFNEKSDIYSFGLILWELYTGHELFPGIDSENTLMEAVCVKNQRPEIPPNTPKHFQDLLTLCWDTNPNKRPSMMQVINSLDEIIIESAIEDEIARKFWKKYFAGKDNVSWVEFWQALCQFMSINQPSGITLDEESLKVKFRCLRVLFDLPPHETTGEVSIEKFGNILKWFGPMIASDTHSTFLHTIQDILLKPGFHLKCDKNMSHQLLNGKLVGSFLIRFSSEPSNFALTASTSAPGITSTTPSHPNVVHFRLKYRYDALHSTKSGYEFDNQLFLQMDDFIEQVRKKYGITQPLLDEQYQPLLLQNSTDEDVNPYVDKIK